MDRPGRTAYAFDRSADATIAAADALMHDCVLHGTINVPRLAACVDTAARHDDPNIQAATCARIVVGCLRAKQHVPESIARETDNLLRGGAPALTDGEQAAMAAAIIADAGKTPPVVGVGTLSRLDLGLHAACIAVGRLHMDHNPPQAAQVLPQVLAYWADPNLDLPPQANGSSLANTVHAAIASGVMSPMDAITMGRSIAARGGPWVITGHTIAQDDPTVPLVIYGDDKNQTTVLEQRLLAHPERITSVWEHLFHDGQDLRHMERVMRATLQMHPHLVEPTRQALGEQMAKHQDLMSDAAVSATLPACKDPVFHRSTHTHGRLASAVELWSDLRDGDLTDADAQIVMPALRLGADVPGLHRWAAMHGNPHAHVAWLAKDHSGNSVANAINAKDTSLTVAVLEHALERYNTQPDDPHVDAVMMAITNIQHLHASRAVRDGHSACAMAAMRITHATCKDHDLTPMEASGLAHQACATVPPSLIQRLVPIWMRCTMDDAVSPSQRSLATAGLAVVGNQR